MDGKRVEMGPGEVSFGGDLNTKPDAQGRKGHRSGTVDDQPALTMLVQLEKDPFVRGRESAPSATKTQLRPVDTLPKIQDHLERSLKLQRAIKVP